MFDIGELFIPVLLGVVIVAIIGIIIAFRCGYSYRRKIAELKINSAEEEAKRIIDAAKVKAEKDAENGRKVYYSDNIDTKLYYDQDEIEKIVKTIRNSKYQDEQAIASKL